MNMISFNNSVCSGVENKPWSAVTLECWRKGCWPSGKLDYPNRDAQGSHRGTAAC